MEALSQSHAGANRVRWMRVAKDRALRSLLPRVIIETQDETILNVLANRHGLRQYQRLPAPLHNFRGHELASVAAGPETPMARRPIRRKRAITWEEHGQIVEREKNRSEKLSTSWHGIWGVPIGPCAICTPEDVDWQTLTLSASFG